MCVRCLALAVFLCVAGCGDDAVIPPSVGVTLAPATVTALVGTFIQFAVGVTGPVDAVAFAVNDVPGGNPTVGTIDADGLYRAPAIVPAGTAITVTATASSSETGTSASDTSTVTLDSGVRVSVTPSSAFTIGTNETFIFQAAVSGVPQTAAISGVCNNVTSTPVPCTAVTWSVSGGGGVNGTTGLYTAPATTGTATLTATSVYDTIRAASAGATIVTATDPTVTSISNTIGAVGAFFQDIYLTGANFISTTEVLVDGDQLPTSAIAATSSTSLRVRIPSSKLASAGVPLVLQARRQLGPTQACPSPCQIVLSAVRPVVVGMSPDTVPQGSSPTLNVNGGYFGAPGARVVTAQFNGQPAPPVDTPASIDRRLSVPLGMLSVPGLYPLTVLNQTAQGPGAPRAAVNLAVQPTYSAPPSAPTTLTVGTQLSPQPAAVAINTATGRAIVVNQGSHDLTVIDMTTASPAVVAASVCTGELGPSTAPCVVASAPVSVAVDNFRNIALVANSGTQTVAVVNLASTPPVVTAIIPSGPTSIEDIPMGVGINPLTGRALVAYQSRNVASIIDLTVSPAAVIGSVTANTGGAPRVAVSPKLNWAVVTPGGGSGSLTIVDLGRLSVVATFAGSPSVTGVAVNDETQKAILVDPTGPGLILNLLNQTREQVDGLELFGNTAVAFNPLANIALVVDRINGKASVIDPVSLAVMANGTIVGLNQPVDVAIDPGTNNAVIVNQAGNSVSIFALGALRNSPHVLQVSRQVGAPALVAPPEVEITSTLTTAASPVDQTVTVIGSGFLSGTPVVRLDGTPLITTVVSARRLTAVVPAAMQTGPRRYALDISNGASAVSNAASFTVIQNVDVSQSGCSAAPQGVAIDSRRNLAVVTNAGCNTVAIINLATGTGVGPLPVAVGTNPQGVAVHTQTGLAVVANQGSNNASIVDVVTPTEVIKVNTNPGPTGVAIDPGLNRAVVTARNANVINTFAVSSTPGTVTSFSVQGQPVAVAINPDRHLAAVANASSNSVSLVDLTQASATQHISAGNLPSGITYDPVSTTFLAVSSLTNQLLVLDPISRSTATLQVGINPTSLAYNFASSTLVTTNSLSQTMTVVDFLDGRVRAVLSVKPSTQFAVDIHPFSNLAVIADSANNRVILRPLPQ